MATIFDWDDRSFKAFTKLYKNSPSKARRATAQLLSQFAFATRQQAIIEINRSMTVRSKKFVESRLRFKRARNEQIDHQRSKTFSVGAKNFSGWEEQMTGGKQKGTRTQSLLARSGNFDKKVKPSNRMKPGRNFINRGDYDLPRGGDEMKVYFIKVRTQNPNKPFIVKKRYKRVKKGLYIFKRGKMRMLQNFEASPRATKVNPWMRRARANFNKQMDIGKEWEKSLRTVYKFK